MSNFNKYGLIPEGYEEVKVGTVKYDDLTFNSITKLYEKSTNQDVGSRVNSYYCVLRKKEDSSISNWKKMPETFGYYFFCADLKDYDLAVVIRVETRQVNINDKEFWTCPYSTSKQITPTMGWWQGPFQPEKPL